MELHYTAPAKRLLPYPANEKAARERREEPPQGPSMNRLDDGISAQKRVRRGVIGVLERNGRYLMIRRAAGIAKGGSWCFPGGHVERGETPGRAVVRELAEELGIRVEPIARVGSVRVLDSRHILAIWRVRHVDGEFRMAPAEIAEMRWMTPAEVREIRPTLPSNEPVLEMLAAESSPLSE